MSTLADDLIQRLVEVVTTKFIPERKAAFVAGALGNNQLLIDLGLLPSEVGIDYAAGRAFAQLVGDNVPQRIGIAARLAGRDAAIAAVVKSLEPLLLRTMVACYERAKAELVAA